MQGREGKIKHILFKNKQIFTFFCRAKDEYSLHSPLVFDFYTKAIRKRKDTLEQAVLRYFSPKCKTDFFIAEDELSGQISKALQGDEDRVIFVKNIRKTKNNLALWHKIKSIRGIVFVSIDFYSSGLIIKNRNLKKKQDYILKSK
ncbi:MAG: hypothetical protein IJ748_02955 [Bacteroidales bacterium]|nr:hypothetical protein [Bacteroidales bacterium]